VAIPTGVQVDLNGPEIRVKGPKGELMMRVRPEITVRPDGDLLRLERPSDEPTMRKLHGLTRALINNMIVGVSRGFERTLQVEGVGYRPDLEGKNLVLYVGYSHPVKIPPPSGITFDVDTRGRTIKVIGCDKELVGRTAADIRKVRPPEPYKGKGIRYIEERVRRKAGKAGKVG
jgi:large subunit ribosomal protein L6